MPSSGWAGMVGVGDRRIEGMAFIARILASLREAQHDVGDDAGDRDVEPDGKGPARDFAVLRDAAGEREEKCDEDQGQGDDGQNDVAGEQRRDRTCGGGVERIADVAVQRVVQRCSRPETAWRRRRP